MRIILCLSLMLSQDSCYSCFAILRLFLGSHRLPLIGSAMKWNPFQPPWTADGHKPFNEPCDPWNQLTMRLELWHPRICRSSNSTPKMKPVVTGYLTSCLAINVLLLVCPLSFQNLANSQQDSSVGHDTRILQPERMLYTGGGLT